MFVHDRKILARSEDYNQKSFADDLKCVFELQLRKI